MDVKITMGKKNCIGGENICIELLENFANWRSDDIRVDIEELKINNQC